MPQSRFHPPAPRPPACLHRIADLRAQVMAWRQGGARVALVPTMGALHAGHLALVDAARAQAERVVVSIFVNPTQFAPHEDFDAYPRAEAADLAALTAHAADGVFMPTAVEMYPPGFATHIVPAGAALGLEAEFRPHFFTGVATVVAKLLLACEPDIALFGEKDYQQLQVIKQIVRDLNLPVEIIGAPTVRGADGLALSSRNAYLDAAERQVAPALHATLTRTAAAIRGGAAIAAAIAAGVASLQAAGFRQVDYLAARAADLSDLPDPFLPPDAPPARLLVAAWLGRTRLIDNIAL